MRISTRFGTWAGFGISLAAMLAAASPASAHETPAEAANRKVVVDFYKALDDADAANAMKARIQGIAERYISPNYIQHAAAFADEGGNGNGRDKLVHMFQSMPAMKAPPPAKPIAIMAENDLVMMLTSREMPDPATGKVQQSYIFNMFRVKDGKLVEHWDLSQKPSGVGGPGMPPPGAMPPGGPPPGAMPPAAMMPPPPGNQP